MVYEAGCFFPKCIQGGSVEYIVQSDMQRPDCKRQLHAQNPARIELKMSLYFPFRCASTRRRRTGAMACLVVLAIFTVLHHGHRPPENLNQESTLFNREIELNRTLYNSSSLISELNTCRPTETNTCVIPSNEELHSKYKADIGSITFDALEREIFASSYQEVTSLLKRTNDLLAEKIKSLAGTDERNGTIEKQYFDGDLLKIGSYDYMAGGRWRPSDCNAKWKVAIVIPFRDRNVHLAMLLHNLIPFLQNQKLEFGVFVGEQYNNLEFNRGLMKNVGYREATRFGDWDCVIFHDTDLVPMKGENYYGCDHFPRHFAAYTEQFKYRLPYEDIFGGVVGLTAEQVSESNGYSNAYWGWGGEDDELLARLNRKGFKATREKEHGYYRSLRHKPKLKTQLCPEVDCLYNNFQLRVDWEGINNMTYSKEGLELFPLYTKISVDIQKDVWNSNMPPCQNVANDGKN